jgi:two-component system response regulator NreC
MEESTSRERVAASAAMMEIWPQSPCGHHRRHRLLLIDDHTVVREGLAALLSLEADLEVIATASSAIDGIKLVAIHEPDLVISDLTMPGCTGGMAVRLLSEAFPTLRILVLSVNASHESIRAAFSAGATGYVRKDASRDEVLRAIRRAAAGERTTCLAVGDAILRAWLDQSVPVEETNALPIDAEAKRLLRLIALGVPNWRIAEQLGRGVKAVEKYRAQLLRRLNLGNAAAVARFAVKLNLLSQQEMDRILGCATAAGRVTAPGADA